MYTAREKVYTTMASQLIQFRLSGESLQALQELAEGGESLNLTAQRLMKNLLLQQETSTPTPPSLSTVSTEDVGQIVESIIEQKLSCLQQRIQEEVQTEVKKLSSQIDARVNLADADVDSLKESVDKLQETVDTLQKERDELDARNLELEALEADLKNVIALKDEEMEQLRSTQEPDYQSVANRVLASLKLGTQSPQYKSAKKAIAHFIQQLTADN
jgi:paraquat-inducible protein B